jgi:hypothetical protein
VPAILDLVSYPVIRCSPPQQRPVLVGMLIILPVGVLLAILAVVADGTVVQQLVAAAVTSGLIVLLLLCIYLARMRSWTECTPAALRFRKLVRTRQYAWDQISEIAIRPYHGRGTSTYCVMITARGGRRIRLGAPVDAQPGRHEPDPEFSAQVAQIRDCWQAATGAPGSGPDRPAGIPHDGRPGWGR